MRYAGFIDQTYSGRSITPAGDRCINLFPESVPSGSPENAYVLIGTPGTKKFAQLPTAPVQGEYTEPATKRMFAVSGSTFYEVFRDGTFRSHGIIDGGYYTFSSNSQQLFVTAASGGSGYILDLQTIGANITQIPDTDFLGSISGVMIDNYFISAKPNSREFQISGILDGLNWGATDVALEEGGSDNIVNTIADHRELWIFGSRHAQPYVNTGAANFPFERINGTFVEQGLAAAKSLIQLDNTIFWLGENQHGNCMVFRMENYSPKRVSNRAVEYWFSQYAKVSGVTDAEAYGYQDESGHTFYVLTFPSATIELSSVGGVVQNVVRGATWVYDVSEDKWHERQNLNNGQFGQHVGKYHTFAFGKHLVGGGDQTGIIYELSSDLYNDNGRPTKRIRRAPHIIDELQTLVYSRLRLGCQVGAGPTDDPNNVVTLRVSNDGGLTWSGEHNKALGDAGQYQTQVEWRALGRAQRRSFEISTMINAPVTLTDAYLDIVKGNR